jgi:hypothetical protein
MEELGGDPIVSLPFEPGERERDELGVREVKGEGEDSYHSHSLNSEHILPSAGSLHTYPPIEPMLSVPMYLSHSQNVQFNPCSTTSVSEPLHHELHNNVSSSPEHDIHNHEQNSMSACLSEPPGLSCRDNNAINFIWCKLYETIPSDALEALNSLYYSGHGDTILWCMMVLILKGQKNKSSSTYDDQGHGNDPAVWMNTEVQEPPSPVTIQSSHLDLISNEGSSVPHINHPDVLLKNSDVSNVGLLNSQNLIHDFKVDIIFSGGGFVTKNSKNENSKYFENFTRISLTDNSSIPKYHYHDQIPFSFTFLNFIIHMVLFLVVDSSYELHFSHHFLLQRRKCSRDS